MSSSAFLKQRQRAPGILVGDLLALSRGETATKRRSSSPAPHLVECPVCHHDRWDGQSAHPRGGRQFGRKCYGPSKDERDRLAGMATASAPLVAELLELASPSHEGAAPFDEFRIPEATTLNPHHFKILGPAAKP